MNNNNFMNNFFNDENKINDNNNNKRNIKILSINDIEENNGIKNLEIHNISPMENLINKKNNLRKIIKSKYEKIITIGKYKNKKFIDVHNSKDKQYNKNIKNRKNIKNISLIEYRNFLNLIEEYHLIKLEIRNYENNNIDLNENKYDFEEKEEKKNDIINDGENLFIISEKIEKFYNNQISKIKFNTFPLELTISEDFHKNSYLINNLISITNELNQQYKNDFRYIHIIVKSPKGEDRTVRLNYNDLLNGNFRATYDLIERILIHWID